MIDDNLAILRTHRNNIRRYRRLLKTKLTSLERSYIERRIAEEKAAMEAVAATTFPIRLSAAKRSCHLDDGPLGKNC